LVHFHLDGKDVIHWGEILGEGHGKMEDEIH
jgi:hypothetical protein